MSLPKQFALYLNGLFKMHLAFLESYLWCLDSWENDIQLRQEIFDNG